MQLIIWRKSKILPIVNKVFICDDGAGMFGDMDEIDDNDDDGDNNILVICFSMDF